MRKKAIRTHKTPVSIQSGEGPKLFFLGKASVLLIKLYYEKVVLVSKTKTLPLVSGYDLVKIQ